MKRAIGLLSFLLTLVFSCLNKVEKSTRKETITKFISAIESFDTLQLYRIVDTGYYFDLYGEEGFMHEVERLRENFRKCGSHYLDTAIKIQRLNIPFTEYTYSFCRGDKGIRTDDSFEIVFRFADFEHINRISTFDVEYKFILPNTSIQSPDDH